MSTTHPEMLAEQAYLDAAHEQLNRGHADAEVSLQTFVPGDRATKRALQRALDILRDSRGTGALIFGRFDRDGESLYVGRRRVHTDDKDLLVVGWHAPAAARFYEATPDEPLGLELKRTFIEEDRRFVRIVDEILAGSAAEASGPSSAGPMISDALLTELERSRDGAMRDVIATIQAEQYRIIRHESRGTVVVRGGPGTGKTIVGLHRAAWLAFNDISLRRTGMLVVTPTVTLLSYISGVLPHLDVKDVMQGDLAGLYGGDAQLRSVEKGIVARTKGSAQMATVLARALQQRIGSGQDAIDIPVGGDRVHLSAVTIDSVLADVRARDLPHNAARELLRDRFAAEIHRAYVAQRKEAQRPAVANEATIRRLSAFTNALDRLWPTFSPEELLRSLYGTQAWLVGAAAEVLTADERAALYRAPQSSIADEPWTLEDLYCLDELSFLLNGEVITYGHIVIDEAQDLSPMQARALARRCPSGSFTILGDLAQATGHWKRDDWSELTDHFSPAVSIEELTIGYRVPSSVLELAARQLPLIAPGLTAPLSVRDGLDEPSATYVPDASLLLTTAWAEAEALVKLSMSVAIIIEDSTYHQALEALRALGPVGDGLAGEFNEPVSLVPASHAQGLEFDAVVLVEPAAIVDGDGQGRRALYVAMTRCSQTLRIVHQHELPLGLEALDGTPPSAFLEDAPDEPPTVHPDPDREHLRDLIDQLDEPDLTLVLQLVSRLLSPTDRPLLTLPKAQLDR
ncbi:HelD family protein [Sanguibacter suaedae]|uniref:AAA family ATPase n=1 Tax=Sanguibacter suaedae TaxID=2795737 RepID=A0A934IBN7_9MICO|nr:ATP-binding domain-containing protein [Sanguibacter suaedae]MBI9114983.1 AAA family ATPase [Sanguibacter suaedae]